MRFLLATLLAIFAVVSCMRMPSVTDTHRETASPSAGQKLPPHMMTSGPAGAMPRDAVDPNPITDPVR